jgi:hypothetical protein
MCTVKLNRLRQDLLDIKLQDDDGEFLATCDQFVCITSWAYEETTYKWKCVRAIEPYIPGIC